MAKTKEDDDFLAGLLGEVDSNIPAPIPRSGKRNRSPAHRKVRVLSPEPATKKKKVIDSRLPSPDLDDDDFIPPVDDPLPSDIPMSDPAPSSPTVKVAERKAQIKEEPVSDDEDDEEMMEVAHVGSVATTSVNIAGSKPVKKDLKRPAYPSPASSSPPEAAQAAAATVDSSAWNELNDKLNVVTSSPHPATRIVGKIDPNDAVEEDGSLNMFWTDYTEVSGSLCLFGKVLNKKTSTYVSCFAKVDNIYRKLYFLPRKFRLENGVETDEEVEMKDVFEEVDEMMTNMKVPIHKIKECKRKYAFELRDVPREAEYLKLFYPYTSTSSPALPTRRSLRNCVSV